MMVKLLLVGTGGFLGAVFRYVVGGWAHRLSGYHWFPYGTLTVNILGCFMIGVIGGMARSRPILTDDVHLFLVVGLLGGFTTFSSFSHETVMMAKNTQALAALLNIFFQIVICLGAAWLGHYLTAR